MELAPPPPPPPVLPHSSADYNTARKQRSERGEIRKSILMRSQCANVFPSPHMFTIWTIPSRWDPRVFMYSSTTALCTKAMIKKMKQLDLPVHCTVSTSIEYDLIEITPANPDGIIYRIEEFAWLYELHEVVQRYEDKVIEEDFSVVVPVGITLYNLNGSTDGHAIIGILSKRDETTMYFHICDGNGFVEDWHKPFMKAIKMHYSNYSPQVVPYFDKSQPTVNYLETNIVKGYLARVGIQYPKLDGQCAFLAYIYTLDQLCTGITRKGHGLRLFQDLLLREDPIEHMTPWETAIVSAYVMATAYRVLQIMIEFYPTKEVAVQKGWNPELDYPDLDAIRPIQISKHVDRNLLKLTRR